MEGAAGETERESIDQRNGGAQIKKFPKNQVRVGRKPRNWVHRKKVKITVGRRPFSRVILTKKKGEGNTSGRCRREEQLG